MHTRCAFVNKRGPSPHPSINRPALGGESHQRFILGYTSQTGSHVRVRCSAGELRATLTAICAPMAGGES